MAVSRGAVLLMFLLVVAAEMGTIDATMGVGKQILSKDKVTEEAAAGEKGLEKKTVPCLTEALEFKGFCYDSDKCTEKCLKAKFPGGECRRHGSWGIRKCYCKHPCE